MEDSFNKRRGEIFLQLGALKRKAEVISARHLLDIAADNTLTINLGYHHADRVRAAALTVRLAEDKAYQDIIGQIETLEAERLSYKWDEDEYAGAAWESRN